MPQLPPVIMLMGPTASGKTALSFFLADNIPVELISVDSALVYRGMDIGSSKPSSKEREKYTHHLIDICSPAEAYSAAQFRQDAQKSIADILRKGKIPVLVGGTMLYYRALTQGLSDLPAADECIRKDLQAFAELNGLLALHRRLQLIDPVAAQKIHPNDPQRTQRAIEVFEISGKPISQWWAEQKAVKLPYEILKIAVSPGERSVLHRRIEARFNQMLDEGFIEEVERLRNRGDLNLDKPSMRAVGYRQVWQYLDGDCSYEEMRSKGVIATRQLAKRQLTWLRSESDLKRFNSDERGCELKILNTVELLLSTAER